MSATLAAGQSTIELTPPSTGGHGGNERHEWVSDNLTLNIVNTNPFDDSEAPLRPVIPFREVLRRWTAVQRPLLPSFTPKPFT